MKISNPKKQPGGFALLISLIVVGVVITVGLSILDISITQVRLSDNAEQSEIAFNAANAGMECGQYWTRSLASIMASGGAFLDGGNPPQCFGANANVLINGDSISSGTGDGEISGTGSAYVYDDEFDWSGSVPRCSRISTLVVNANDVSSDLTVNGVPTLIAGYPESTFVCEGGSRCTILSVRGYNKSCGNIGSFGTTEREVLLQF
jgi:hypothetical protein